MAGRPVKESTADLLAAVPLEQAAGMKVLDIQSLMGWGPATAKNVYQRIQARWDVMQEQRGAVRAPVGLPEPPHAPVASSAAERLADVTGPASVPETDAPAYTVSEVPDEDEPIEELIARRCAAYGRSQSRAAMEGPRTVTMRDDLPIAIAHVGDPHLDDDGCDWPRLRRDIETIASAPGMLAGNVGDMTNSWIGRLTRLYAHQSTTHREEVRLGQWYFSTLPHLYAVPGNHDDWHPDAFRRMVSGARIDVLAKHEAKIAIQFPIDVEVRLSVRHTYKGTSMYNPVHGHKRESWRNPWADIYVAGHHHEAAQASEMRADGRPVHFVKAAGYKRHDSHASLLQFADAQYGETVTTIIDPHAPPESRVRVEYNVQEAAEMLAWLRRRRA